MPRSSVEQDTVVDRLDAIVALLQDLFIFEATRAGLSRGQVRSILGINNNRVSRVAKHLGRIRHAGD